MQLSTPFQLENFIDGEFHHHANGQLIDNINPATGEVCGQIPNSSDIDIQMAVVAAKKAFPSWSKTSTETRFKLLNRIADLIDENLNELALAESNDNGKPLWLSKEVDIPRASSNFRFFATACMHFAWAVAEPDRIQIPFQKHWRRGVRSWTASSRRSWPAFFRAPSDQPAQL